MWHTMTLGEKISHIGFHVFAWGMMVGIAAIPFLIR